jgi:2',3'-cyclic-nucleotide 2'-phosphodiesterase (5'-nucleotidase family)
LLPPQGNPVASKPVGAVSQLDIENVMRFNNKLIVFETTPAGLLALIEHGVSATAPGATPGQFPQVGGMKFSFDPTLPAGMRVRSLVILDAAGNPVDRVVQNGVLLGNLSRVIKVVTLNFLANGG